MQFNSFDIYYPAIFQGTEKTEVTFIDTKKELFNKLNDNTDYNLKNVFVTDSNLLKIAEVSDFFDKMDKKAQCTVVLEAGEQNKTLDSVMKIVKSAIQIGANRNSVFYGIGGGTVTDMTAFASSIFMRGAKLELIPTTLLGMVDASCGGKTGSDFEQCKNMIGTFYPSQKIIVCKEFLNSLSELEYFSGLAEVLKTAMLFDKDLYNLFLNSELNILQKEPITLNTMIYKCLKAKSLIVEQDLTEKNTRKLLNFGHTFGHALESVVGFGKVSHGFAVAFGIKKAILLSTKLGLCSEEYKNQVLDILKKFDFDREYSFNSIDLLNAMKKDKKIDSGKVKLILQKDLCDTVILDVDDDMILEVLNG